MPARATPPNQGPAVSGERLESPDCRCCGTPEARFRGTKTGRFIRREFRFYTCERCGFTFVEPVTDFSIYNDAYYAGQGPDPLVNYREEYADYAGTPRRYEFEDLSRIARAHWQRSAAVTRASAVGGAGDNPPASVARWLDYGCGAGGLLKYLRDMGGFEGVNGGGQRTGLDIVGHDVGSYAERLKHEDKFKILDAAELDDPAAGHYDVITCIEVMEHLPDPWVAVERMARLLRPGGLLLLTTGNFAGPLARLLGIRFPYCIPEIHISLFTPATLRHLYQRAGLTPVNVRYDGVLRFRLLKSLPLLPLGARFQGLTRLRAVRAVMDRIYGVSAMPCAVKPLPLAP